MSILDSKIPSGPLADKWTKHKNEIDPLIRIKIPFLKRC